MKETIAVADDEPVGGDGALCLDRGGAAKPVIVVRVVVRVRPPALGYRGRGDLGVLSIGEVDRVARRVMRGKPRHAAVVAGNRISRRSVAQRQRERCGAGAGVRQPVGDLLSVHKLSESRNACPRACGGGLCANDDLVRGRLRAALYPRRAVPAFEHIGRDGRVQPQRVDDGVRGRGRRDLHIVLIPNGNLRTSQHDARSLS